MHYSTVCNRNSLTPDDGGAAYLDLFLKLIRLYHINFMLDYWPWWSFLGIENLPKKAESFLL